MFWVGMTSVRSSQEEQMNVFGRPGDLGATKLTA